MEKRISKPLFSPSFTVTCSKYDNKASAVIGQCAVDRVLNEWITCGNPLTIDSGKVNKFPNSGRNGICTIFAEDIARGSNIRLQIRRTTYGFLMGGLKEIRLIVADVINQLWAKHKRINCFSTWCLVQCVRITVEKSLDGTQIFLNGTW